MASRGPSDVNCAANSGGAEILKRNADCSGGGAYMQEGPTLNGCTVQPRGMLMASAIRNTKPYNERAA